MDTILWLMLLARHIRIPDDFTLAALVTNVVHKLLAWSFNAQSAHRRRLLRQVAIRSGHIGFITFVLIHVDELARWVLLVRLLRWVMLSIIDRHLTRHHSIFLPIWCTFSRLMRGWLLPCVGTLPRLRLLGLQNILIACWLLGTQIDHWKLVLVTATRSLSMLVVLNWRWLEDRWAIDDLSWTALIQGCSTVVVCVV